MKILVYLVWYVAQSFSIWINLDLIWFGSVNIPTPKHLPFSDWLLDDNLMQRKKRRRRHKREQNLYMQLSEAMECIEHICTQGCTLVGPSNVVDNNNHMSTTVEKSKPCKAFSTCYGLQLLIRHFAVCKRRSNEKGCLRCKRMLQLLRLHSSICDQPESCRVPLCRYMFEPM